MDKKETMVNPLPMPVTKEEMINSYKSVERRQSSSNRMFGGYDFEYISLYSAGKLMDSWAALQTGERDERIKELESNINAREAIIRGWVDAGLKQVERIKELEDGLRGFRDGYDHDNDAHKYEKQDSQCRVCIATLLLNRPNGV